MIGKKYSCNNTLKRQLNRGWDFVIQNTIYHSESFSTSRKHQESLPKDGMDWDKLATN
jgi:hypothetical protein